MLPGAVPLTLADSGWIELVIFVLIGGFALLAKLVDYLRKVGQGDERQEPPARPQRRQQRTPQAPRRQPARSERPAPPRPQVDMTAQQGRGFRPQQAQPARGEARPQRGVRRQAYRTAREFLEAGDVETEGPQTPEVSAERWQQLLREQQVQARRTQRRARAQARTAAAKPQTAASRKNLELGSLAGGYGKGPAEAAFRVDLGSPGSARRAVVYHEILAPPKALRRRPEPWDL